MKNLFRAFPFGNGPFNVDQRGLDTPARDRVLAAVCAAGYVVVGEAAGDFGLELAIAADHFTIERRPLFSTNVDNGEPPAYFDLASGALVFSQVEAAEAMGDEPTTARNSDMETRERGSAWFRDRVTMAELPASVSPVSAEMGKTIVVGDIHGDSADRTLAAIQKAGYAISSELKALVETRVPFTFISGAIIRDLAFMPTCENVA